MRPSKHSLPLAIALAVTILSLDALTSVALAQDVTIKVDAAHPVGPLRPVWNYFGYDEPNYTYMKDGKKLLSELAALSPVPVHVRAHTELPTPNHLRS